MVVSNSFVWLILPIPDNTIMYIAGLANLYSSTVLFSIVTISSRNFRQ